ncbi:hypothetical protein K9M18_05615, partial [Candidatus Woesearchaeota archaeon]|nr:hypothetical protein [Candidatus Woesearchaeota archaeon]
VEVKITTKADIIFKNKKGNETAIEVETGIDFSKHRTRLIEKFERVKKEYGDNTIIFLIDSQDRRKYERIAQQIPIIVRTQIQDFIQQQFK